MKTNKLSGYSLLSLSNENLHQRHWFWGTYAW